MVVRSMLAVVVFLGSLTLGIVLPLTVAVPASHAQSQVRNSGFLICSIIPERNTGYAIIFPPEVFSSNVLYWIAAVHHWDASSNYTGFTWTNYLWYTPPDAPYYLRPGGWSDPTTGQGFFVAPAHALGYVQIQPYVFDWVTQQWIAYGSHIFDWTTRQWVAVQGPSCLVFTSIGD
jgi:hypothetical protein